MLEGSESGRFGHEQSDCCTKHRHTSEPMHGHTCPDHLPRQLQPQRGSKSSRPENNYQDCESKRRVWIQFCFFETSLVVLHIVFSSRSAVTSLSLSKSPSRWRDLPVFLLQALNQADLIFLPKSLSSDRGNLLETSKHH